MPSTKYKHKSGWITLYSDRGTMMIKTRYSTIWGRKKTIERWEKFYQDRFKKFYYHIAPDLTQKEALINDRITNG